jgi:hypothetical protein
MNTATRDGGKVEGGGRPLDIWLALVIVILILTFGGGLFLTAKAVLARIDAAELDFRTRQQQLQIEVFAVRKQLMDVEHNVRKLVAADPRAVAAGLPRGPAGR